MSASDSPGLLAGNPLPWWGAPGEDLASRSIDGGQARRRGPFHDDHHLPNGSSRKR
ncbi:MAG: hypothetical protein JWN19_3182, partial [Arthrobacter sp.]|nr:hypothetical protein [Arthrobacter sp.]